MSIAAKKYTDPVVFIAAIFFVRLFSLFSFLPLFLSLPALAHSSWSHWVLAFYPFFQACFQIPAGWLSDRYNPLIVIQWGLYLFAFGTILAWAAPDNIWILGLARILQGACALGAPAQAWLAQISQSSKELHTRYYLIGAGVVAGIFSGLLSATFFESLRYPQGVFLMTLGIIFILIFSSYSYSQFVHQVKKNHHVKPERLSLDSRITPILNANLLLHFIQSFLLGGLSFWQSNLLGYSRSFVMMFGLLLAFFCAAYPLRKRQLSISFTFSFYVAFIAAVLSLIMLLPFLQFIGIFGTLVCVFSLLLVLEAALPTSLRQYDKNSGLWLGIYATVQYFSISLGSFFSEYAQFIYCYSAVLFISSTLLALSLSQLKKSVLLIDSSSHV